MCIFYTDRRFKLNHLLIQTLGMFVVIYSSCIVSNYQLFTNIQNTSDTTYGYTRMNPISFTNGDIQQSTEALLYYLDHLRTADEKKLIPLMHYTLDNPEYNSDKIRVENKYGAPAGLKERFLDLWVMKVENEPDTIYLYFSMIKKDTVKVPIGLKFVH